MTFLQQCATLRSFVTPTHLFIIFGILAGGLVTDNAIASKDNKTIEDLLALKKAPDGVVIEIVTWDEDNLEWALPLARSHVDKLKQKFPNIPLAIVSHGTEQFALTKDNAENQKEVHSLVKSLSKDNVPVHVCGTFAGWRGLADEDFPDYVDVTAAGPATVNDYIAMGYALIIIESDDGP